MCTDHIERDKTKVITACCGGEFKFSVGNVDFYGTLYYLVSVIQIVNLATRMKVALRLQENVGI